MASVVRMMDQFLGVSTPAGNQSHFQRVTSQADADTCRRPGTAATVRITEKPWRYTPVPGWCPCHPIHRTVLVFLRRWVCSAVHEGGTPTYTVLSRGDPPSWYECWNARCLGSLQ